MKTVRFSNVVRKSGRPEAYLILVEPSKDRILQAAIKANRVMTVQQFAVGTKTDRGEIGFHPGPSRQFLVFPKSLRTFRGHVVFGIKYDLLDNAEKAAPAEHSTAARSPKKDSRKAPTRKVRARKAPKEKPVTKPPARRPTRTGAPKSPRPSGSKVIPFQPAHSEAPREESLAELKKQVRRAMKALEEGKAVAAFHLLQRIVEN